MDQIVPIFTDFLVIFTIISLPGHIRTKYGKCTLSEIDFATTLLSYTVWLDTPLPRYVPILATNIAGNICTITPYAEKYYIYYLIWTAYH